MKKHIAILDKDNIVINLIVGKSIPANGVDVSNDKTAAIGKRYSNGKFEKVAPTLEVVHELRKAAYPPITDLADALYWQSQGDETKMEAYIQTCADVKAMYPKPLEETT